MLKHLELESVVLRLVVTNLDHTHNTKKPRREILTKKKKSQRLYYRRKTRIINGLYTPFILPTGIKCKNTNVKCKDHSQNSWTADGTQHNYVFGRITAFSRKPRLHRITYIITTEPHRHPAPQCNPRSIEEKESKNGTP